LLRSVRLVVRGATPEPAAASTEGTITDLATATTGSRDAFFGDSYLTTPTYDGTVLASGVRIDGPALIEEAFTVVVVPPGAHVTVDEHGNYDLRLR
jgi:N-methylhydantoinase A/oxoprolinase/acetone carboxylase beta subunit